MMQNNESDRLLSTKQAAAASGFHQTHFNAVITDGKLPATKDERGRWQIKQSDLDKYLSSKTVKPRRPKEFTNKTEGAETSLLTQLDEKDKEIQNLKLELDASKRVIDDLNIKYEDEIQDLTANISEVEGKLQRAKNRIEGLKEENAELRDENREHTGFLRSTLRELLQYVTK